MGQVTNVRTPALAGYQALVNRSEQRKPQPPEAAPLLAARQAVREQWQDILPASPFVDFAGDDDADWHQPTTVSAFSLVVAALLALAGLASFLHGLSVLRGWA